MKKLFLLALCSFELSAATYYADWDTGSDANSGTSKGAPWKHLPGMNGFSGSYSHSSGDHFVLKGGVTWPSSCLLWYITEGGAAGNPDVYTVDQTWYSGAAWTPPVIDGEGARETFVFIGTLDPYSASANHIIFDSLVLKNLYWSGVKSPGQVYFWSYADNAADLHWQNCQTLNWSHGGSPGTNDKMYCWVGNNPYVGAGTPISTCSLTNCVADGGTSGKDSGVGVWGAMTVSGCTFQNLANGILRTYDDGSNPIEHSRIGPINLSFYQVGDGQHDNGINFTVGGTHKVSNCVFPGWQSIGVLASSTCTLQFWNDLFYGGVGSGAINLNNYAGMTADIENCTFATGSFSPLRVVYYTGSGGLTRLTLKNNHFITDASGAVALDGGASIATFDDVTNIKVSTSAASSQGYTSANAYAPVSTNGSSVVSGTSLAGGFSGGLDTDLVGAARPALGLWQVGAYSFGGATGGGEEEPPPEPPPATIPLSTYPSIIATNGLISSMTVSNSVLYQLSRTVLGLAVYQVVIPTNGLYTLTASNVLATGDDANSWYVDWNSDPTGDNTRCWDITNFTSGFESRPVGRRGSGTVSAPEFSTNVWSLNAGTNTLYVAGREPGALTGFQISKQEDPLPQPYCTLQFDSSGPIVSDNNGSLILHVLRNLDTNQTTTVHFATADGTALSGINYTATSGDLTFTPGITTQAIEIPLLVDGVYRGNQTFTITLSDPSEDATLVDPNPVTVTLIDSTSPKGALFRNANLRHVQ